MWKIITNSASMYRASGKTWPEISADKNKIWGRDNNSKRPSETLSTDSVNMEGLNFILKGISLPHPTMEQKLEFLNNIK